MESVSRDFSPLAGQPPAIETDFGRAAPLLRVATSLAIVIWVLWSLLHQLPQVAPQLLPQRLAGLGYAQEVQARVDSALLQSRQGLVPRPICAMIGFSGGQEGIDVQQLGDEDGLNVSYLGLCGACDGTITGLEELSAPLYQSNLDIAAVVMAIDPFHLVVRPYTPSLRRTEIKHAADKQLLASRRQILRLFGLGADPRYVDTDPWRTMKHSFTGSLDDEPMQSRLQHYGSRGYYDIGNYLTDGQQAAALRDLVRATRKRDAEPIVLLMPLHPDLVKRLPAAATSTVLSILADLNVPVLDHQQTIAASGFYDISHMNRMGRTEFTAILASDLKHYLDGEINH